MLGSIEQSAALARRLVAAAGRASCSELREEIESVQFRAGLRPACRSAVEDERMDLLEAVAGAMGRSAARSARRISTLPDGREVHLRLLRHLATPPARESAGRAATGAA